jgi:release factor glutamine methyltransferase
MLPIHPNQTQSKTLYELFFFLTLHPTGYNLPMQNWTIQKLLNWITEYLTEKHIDSPRLSAELLLSSVLSFQRIDLYTQFDKPVTKQQLDHLHALVKRAAQNEPVAYLLGKTEFYSLQFNITPDCMIPRPETELLTERAIEFLRTRPGRQFVCDLCTGSACIAVAIAVNCLDARIIATDICDAALSVAAENVEKYQLKERIKLLCGDLQPPLCQCRRI